MKPFYLSLLLAWLATGAFGQSNFYDVNPGDGYGLRFWASDNYKIHMGNSAEYHFGPVTDYSIKMNMSSNAGRGWTWGVTGLTPVAALSNVGDMKIAGTFMSSYLDISNNNIDLSILKLRNSAWACNQRTGIEFWNGGNKSYPTSRIVSQMDGCGGDGEALLFETQTAGATSPSTKFIIKNDGNIGIGTTSPDSKLTVNGTIHAKEVKVDLSIQGPDYVFEKDYNLMSLEEIKAYIEKHKHLPEVPSAKEMETNGVNLSEMNMLLLKKVEELTLHSIKQEERLQILESQNRSLLEANKTTKKRK
jgi:hypothetical protein